ncbi:uncharacterized protein LOC135372842 [Ornithodoros turicata]|uniref:uncharacterized protein LOC135372842 n=1 Tax=Ornithodoros turicata TaxID=34597 RepID=UPI003138A556
MGITWTLTEENITVTRLDKTVTANTRSKLMSTFRGQLSVERDQRLQSLPNQGKTMTCVAQDRSSSHFFRTGSYTRFTDWRFIHKAKLNLLPVNGARPWDHKNDKTCRRCGYQTETLPHVLNHCMTHSRTYTDRHNRIVERVKTAAIAKYTITHENRDVGGLGLRRDLVIARGEEAIILDVTCPFDNGQEAFTTAREEKLRNYQPVVEYLRRRYQKVTVDAIVVGSLGCWDTRNDRIMRRLCSRNYLRLFKRLAVSDVIAASRDVYAKHIAGISA